MFKIKRLMDFLISLISIVILSPIIIIISLIVKLTSKGPVFFRQRRTGKDNVEFYIYKFRTMKIDTPNVATHLLKDPTAYITKIGKFLRKTSLDELPQLFNILSGKMSIVGPRPSLYNQDDLIKLRTESGVSALVPGLTGWAQVNGRDEITISKKVEFDKDYLENKSLWLDIKIIFLTAFKVLKSEGVQDGKVDK
ncbi:sugar transferase [Clostridium gasigenes]|uniref:sugar transferase n=1 Tax=Clostridium gasigenes TaxID=94869 RepID=UPI00339A1A18